MNTDSYINYIESLIMMFYCNNVSSTEEKNVELHVMVTISSTF